MAGPWERFQSAPAEEGPWTRFAASGASPANTAAPRPDFGNVRSGSSSVPGPLHPSAYDAWDDELGDMSLAEQNRAFKERTTFLGRLGDNIRRGWLGLQANIAAGPRMAQIERGAEASETGDVMLGTDPLGMPIYASQAYTRRQLPGVADDQVALGDAVAGDLARRVAPLQAEMAAIPQRPATEALMQADTFREGLGALLTDPLGVIGDIGVPSTVQMGPALAASAVVRRPAFTAGAMGATSAINEFGAGVVGYLADQGVNVSDPKALQAALGDPELVRGAVNEARVRSGIIGSVDAASGGLAGRTLVPQAVARSAAGREAVNVLAAQPVVQAAMGAGGEAAAQLATRGEIKPGEVMAEALGEFFMTPAEVGPFAVQRTIDAARNRRGEPGDATDAAPAQPTPQPPPAGPATRQSEPGPVPQPEPLGDQLTPRAAPPRPRQETPPPDDIDTLLLRNIPQDEAPVAPEPARAAPMPADAAPEAPPTMQNRDRSRAASVAQMQDIRRNPDPDRLGFSRDPNTGAPMVSEGRTVPEQDKGRSDSVVMASGRRVPVRYAVVEASDLAASHDADGNANPAYSSAPLQALNNGRAAGLQAAWASGNAKDYVAGLERDAALHGVSVEAIRSKRQPVLVRLYDPSQNTGDMGAESNASQQLGLSPVEQAQTDARALPDLSGISWAEDGTLNPAANAGFFRAWFRNLGDTASATLQDAQGRPNAAALQRVRAALVHRAYGDERLLTALVEDTNPDNRNVMNALVRAAPAFAALDPDNAVGREIRSALTGGLQMLRDAAARGVSLRDAIAQQDMFGRNADADIAAAFMAENARSARRMADAFQAMAEYAADAELQAATLDVFGTAPTPTTRAAFRRAGVETPDGRFEPAEGAPVRDEQGQPGEQAPGRTALGDAGRVAEEQLGLFGQPTASERVDAERRRRDAVRDGRTGTGRTDMAAGDGELFAGPRPEQTTLEGDRIGEQPIADRRRAARDDTAATGSDLTAIARRMGEADADRLGLREAVERVLGKAGERVIYIRDYQGLPEHLRRSVERRLEQRGGKGRPSALYDPRTQQVYVYTAVNNTPAKALRNAAHEIAGHHGLRTLLGDRLDHALNIALENPTVKAVADAIAKQRKLRGDQRLLAAEEALAELAAVTRTGDYDLIRRAYGVEVPAGMRASVKRAVDNFLRRLKAMVDDIFGRHVFSDEDVRDLLEAAWQAVDGGQTLSMVEADGRAAMMDQGEPGSFDNPLPESEMESAPVGAWVAGPALPGLDTRRQIMDVPLNRIDPTEFDSAGQLAPEKRADAARYAEAMARGEQFPNGRGSELENGLIKLQDGHRRYWAARESGATTLRLAVSPLALNQPANFDQLAIPAAERDAQQQFDESSFRPAVVSWAKETYGDAIAPNGRPVWQNFVAWFGDSQAVDSAGAPLVVYHGSPDARFMDADATFMSLSDRYGEQQGVGAFWFAADRSTAASYADSRRAFDYQNAEARVIPAYLKLENPLIIDGRGRQWREAQAIGKTTDVIKQAKAEGRDGVIVRNVRDNYNNTPRTRPTDTYVVFDSRQIKSATGNRGTFDPDNPNILREGGDSIPYVATDDSVAGGQGARAAGGDSRRSANVDEVTGLPMNDDGTVTVYHHTSADRAESIRRDGLLRADAEPDVYVTTRAETDTGYGDTAVPIRVDPARLELDDEFPNGRRDFRINVGRPGGSIRVRVENDPAAPDSPGAPRVEASRDMFVPTRGDRTQADDRSPQDQQQRRDGGVQLDAYRRGDGARPDFSPELAGRAANAIDEIVRRAGGTVLADTLRRDFQVNQAASLIGLQVTTEQDFATIAQVYRNPLFETLHYVFVDDAGKVLGETAISDRMPAASSAFPGHVIDRRAPASAPVDWIKSVMPPGTTGIWLTHNHPSGNPTPSRADENITGALANLLRQEGGPRLLGHVVLNHNTYGRIGPDGRARDNARLPSAPESDPLRQRRGMVIDQKIDSPSAAATVGKQIAEMIGDDSVGVIVTGAQNDVVTVTSVPAEYLTTARGAGFLSMLGSRSGATSVTIVGSPEALRPITDQGRQSPILRRQLVRDIVEIGPDGRGSSLAATGRIDMGRLGEHSRARRRRADRGLQVYEDGPVYTPEQQDSQTQTPEFRRWFGDSKVVDEQGRPLVVYHGTRSDFSVFDIGRKGAHFGTKEQAAHRIDGENGGQLIMPTYLSIKNPKRVKDTVAWGAQIRRAKDEGYDGIVYLNRVEGVDVAAMEGYSSAELDRMTDQEFKRRFGGADSWIAFRPEQIKSATGNRGTFDPNSPSIMESVDLTPEQQDFMRKAGLAPDTRTTRQKMLDWARGVLPDIQKDSLIAGTLDAYYGLKQAVQRKGGATVETDPYIAARMINIASTMEAILRFGAPKMEGGALRVNRDVPGLFDALRPVQDNLPGFFGWMVARRAKLLKEQGREQLMSDADIQAGLSLRNGHEAAFDEAARNYLRLKNAILDFAEQHGGTIDPAARAAWDHAEYIPFYREDGEGGVAGPGTKRGLTHQSAGIRRLKGGEQNLRDPLANIIQNFTRLMDSALKNRAMQLAVDQLGDTYFKKVPPKMAPGIIPLDQVKKHLLAQGVDQATIDAMPQAALRGVAKMLTIEAPTGDNVVRVMREGKPEYYEVEDPLLLRALTAFNENPTPAWMKPLVWAKNLLTAGATSTPDFLIRNAIRDTGEAAVTAREHFIPVVDTAKGAIESAMMDEFAQDLMMAGSYFHGGLFEQGQYEATSRAIKRALRRHGMGEGKAERFVKTLANPKRMWDLYRAGIEATEMGSRVSLARNRMEATGSFLEGAFEAKDFLDFTLKGDAALLQFFTRVIPFLNARLQGAYRLARAGTAKDRRRRVLARMAVMALASTALYAWNMLMHRDAYDDLEEWDKDAYWHFAPGTDYHIRLPKPFELGLLAGTAVERATAALVHAVTGGEAGDRSDQTLAALLHGITDTLAINPVPQAFKPAAEVYFNYNTFSDRPIESRGDEFLPPSERKTPHTSDFAAWVSRVLEGAVGEENALSPKQLQHLWRGYTGGMGMYLLNAADVGTRWLEGAPPKPESRLRDMPGIGALYRSGQHHTSRWVDEFYDLREVAQTQSNKVKSAMETGEPGRARNLEAEYGWLLGSREESKRAKGGFMHSGVRAIERAGREMAQLRKADRQIYESREMSPAEKRRRLDENARRRNEIAREMVRKLRAREREQGR